MIDLDERQVAIVREILATHAASLKVWVFGSRATGTARRSSDLDLALLGPERIPLGTLGRLREAFSESSLPFFVDLVDLAASDPAVRETVSRTGIPLA